MPGIFDRISGLAGSDVEKAANLAQQTYQNGMSEHGHQGRAFIEAVVKLCRDHPNLVGIAVGILVEQLLSEEKKAFDRRQAQAVVVSPAGDGLVDDPLLPAPSTGEALPADATLVEAAPRRDLHPAERSLRLSKIHPARIAIEVFGGLLLLKFGVAFSHLFRRKSARHDGVFAGAAKIHLLSGSLAAYYFAAALRSPKISAWRNAAVALFGTDAIKPLLKTPKAGKRRR
jgi:hypothetical protein